MKKIVNFLKDYHQAAVTMACSLVLFGILLFLQINTKTLILFGFWTGFINFLIIGGYLINSFTPKARTQKQKFLWVCSGIIVLVFLLFSLSFIKPFNNSWLTTLRWSLFSANIIIYALVSFEISESPENIIRLYLKKIEWRYMLNNTAFIIALASLTINLSPVKNQTLNDYLIISSIILGVGYVVTKIPNKKFFFFSVGGLIVILATFIVIAIFSGTNSLLGNIIHQLGDPQALKTISIINAVLLTIGLILTPCRRTITIVGYD